MSKEKIIILADLEKSLLKVSYDSLELKNMSRIVDAKITATIRLDYLKLKKQALNNLCIKLLLTLDTKIDQVDFVIISLGP